MIIIKATNMIKMNHVTFNNQMSFQFFILVSTFTFSLHIPLKNNNVCTDKYNLILDNFPILEVYNVGIKCYA